MGMPAERYSLWIVPDNDLEASAIIALLSGLGETVLVSGQKWGATWEKLEPNILERIHDALTSGSLVYGVELGGAAPAGALSIDHHAYRDDNRWRPDSSLEQVVRLLNGNRKPDRRISLTREQQLIAANDRGNIAAMRAINATPDETADIRHRDRLRQELTDADREAAEADLSMAEWRHDGLIPFVCLALPPGRRSSSWHGDLIASAQPTSECLIEDEYSWSYSGPRHWQLFSSLNVADFIEKIWAGGEKDLGYFGVERPTPEAQAKIRELLGEAFRGETAASAASLPPAAVENCEFTLLWPLRVSPGTVPHPPNGSLDKMRNDPGVSPAQLLDAYAQSLSHPDLNSQWTRVERPFDEFFGHPSEYGDTTDLQSARRYAELLYFHQFARDIAFPNEREDAGFALFRRSDIKALELELHQKSTDARGLLVRLPVRSIQMALHTLDVAMVAVQLDLPAYRSALLTVDEVLDVLNRVRRIYPPFFPTAPPDHRQLGGAINFTPLRARWIGTRELEFEWTDFSDSEAFLNGLSPKADPAGRHWLDLLHPIATQQLGADPDPHRLYFSQLGDERIPLMVHLAVDNLDAVTEVQRVRLTFLEEPGDSLPYDEAFLKANQEQHEYRRFASLGTFYFGYEAGFVQLTQAGDFARHNLRYHQRLHYFQLFSLAHLQHAILLVLWHQLSQVTRAYVKATTGRASFDRFHRDIGRLSSDFTQFSSVIYFSEVSTQMQGKELFALMCRHLDIPRLFGEVEKQLQLAREQEQMVYRERLDQAAHWVIPIGVTLSFLGISVADWHNLMTGDMWDVRVLWQNLSQGTWDFGPFVRVASLVSVVAILSYGVHGLLRKAEEWRRRR